MVKRKLEITEFVVNGTHFMSWQSNAGKICSITTVILSKCLFKCNFWWFNSLHKNFIPICAFKPFARFNFLNSVSSLNFHLK